MGLRQREWAARKRVELMAVLGGKCVDCETTEKLSFDVIIPVGNPDHHRRMDTSQRMTFYQRQYEANNLACRCDKCNARKSNKLILTAEGEPPEQPF